MIFIVTCCIIIGQEKGGGAIRCLANTQTFLAGSAGTF